MLGTGRLLTFAFRALVSLITISILWSLVAGYYNDLLVALARPMTPGDVVLRSPGTLLAFEAPRLMEPLTVDAFTLHFGLILLMVLVISAVGLGAVERVRWLAAMALGSLLYHVVGVILLSYGISWAARGGSSRLVFSLFAVFWGLVPAAGGGVWAFAYWLPRVREEGEVPTKG